MVLDHDGEGEPLCGLSVLLKRKLHVATDPAIDPDINQSILLLPHQRRHVIPAPVGNDAPRLHGLLLRLVIKPKELPDFELDTQVDFLGHVQLNGVGVEKVAVFLLEGEVLLVGFFAVLEFEVEGGGALELAQEGDFEAGQFEDVVVVDHLLDQVGDLGLEHLVLDKHLPQHLAALLIQNIKLRR